ncbi:MAG: SRPBCC domain-containing protein [Euryarchaeota archaeon]|nr:SRPBCC domain-containing protein [Euryarchaeota archaeon]
MARTIIQSVKFATTPDDLFDTYLDPKRHSAATGGGAMISMKLGAPFTAWDGFIEGVNLAVVAKRLIVQSWRGSDWREDDADSLLVLSFSKDMNGAVLDLVHANVPDDQYEALDAGWHEHYWKPWREYIAENISCLPKRRLKK